MDDPLQDLIRELRAERCPRSVSTRAASRISDARAVDARCRPAWRARFAWGLAVTVLLAVLGLGVIRHRTPRGDIPTQVTAPASPDPALVIAQAQDALVTIGRVLIHARAQTEGTLLNEAVPPLVNGFLSAKNKLIQSL